MGTAPDATARHAILMVAATIIVALLNYALNIILGWTLPIEAYGRVGVSQTLIFICVWFISAGFPWVVTRAIAQAHGPAVGVEHASQREEAWRTYKTAWVANIGLTAVAVALLLASFYMQWLPLERSYEPLIILVAVTVGALGVGAVPNAGLQGLLRFGPISVVRVIEAVASIIISLALVLIGLGAVGALGGFAAAAALATLLNIWLIHDKHFWTVNGWGGLAALKAAIPMTLAVFGGILLTNIDLLAIKFLSAGNSDSLSGAYQVAAVLARAPLFIGTALVTTFYPRIARDAMGREDATSGVELVRWVLLGILPMNVVLAVGAPAVVLFFFPAAYASSAPVLSILAIGSAFLVVAGALAAVLQASHRVAIPALVMSGAVAVQVAALGWFVPLYGTVGAAVASASASMLACGLLIWASRAIGVSARMIGRQALALTGLALLILPLAFFFAGWSRVFVAFWVAAAVVLYLVALLVLNLVSVSELAAVTQGQQRRPLGSAIDHLLSTAQTLNRWGARFEPGTGRDIRL
jgi:O-antigen/teichoic acid export membrane protein